MNTYFRLVCLANLICDQSDLLHVPEFHPYDRSTGIDRWLLAPSRRRKNIVLAISLFSPPIHPLHSSIIRPGLSRNSKCLSTPRSALLFRSCFSVVHRYNVAKMLPQQFFAGVISSIEMNLRPRVRYISLYIYTYIHIYACIYRKYIFMYICL